jgi:hypothetical protein
MISCTFGIVSDANCQAATVMPDTILDHLQTLKIYVHNYGSATFGEFLRPFIVPSLKHLGVNTYSKFSNTLVPFSDVALSLLVQRSSCQLDHFEARSLDPLAVTGLLAKAPLLRKLTLYYLGYDGIHHRDLFSAIGLGKLAPNLHTFECGARDAKSCIDFLETRAKVAALPHSSCTTIRSVVIQCRELCYMQGLEGIKESFDAQGINIHCSY